MFIFLRLHSIGFKTDKFWDLFYIKNILETFFQTKKESWIYCDDVHVLCSAILKKNDFILEHANLIRLEEGMINTTIVKKVTKGIKQFDYSEDVEGVRVLLNEIEIRRQGYFLGDNSQS